jgi:hypothetical protein
MNIKIFRNNTSLLSILFAFFCLVQTEGQKPGNKVLPEIPVGSDSFKRWDQWPLQRIGVRAYMRSTYDRSGKNEAADASHFLFANEEDYNVTLDIKGKGILYFFRANHWHGSPWHFILDGTDNIVRETGTGDPVNALKKFTKTEFIPAEAFPQPLNWTWGTTKGADLLWTPMSFKESLRIAYSRTRYGTGYYIYHLFSDDKNLSQPLSTWNIDQVPDKDVIELLSRTGTDIAPRDIKKLSGKRKLNKSHILLAKIKNSPSVVRAFKITIPFEVADNLERARLKVTWDNSENPSIDAPLCLFFGAGTLYNRENQEFLVKSFPVSIRYDYENKNIELSSYFPMPFYHSAKFELYDVNPANSEATFEIRYEPLLSENHLNSYFHATYTDFPKPVPGHDMLFLDTEGAEGQKEWSGSFVGTSFIFSHNGFLGTLEGDPRFFFDDSKTPQCYGTGTEEWGGGGDYWGGQNMTLPFAGHPCGAAGKDKAKNDKDLIESAYRFLLSDLMPFGRRAVIRFEHGGENLSSEHYESVAYWYGLPYPSLIKSDEIDIGNPASEKDHKYYSPDASEVKSLTSRYEWGIDSFPSKIGVNSAELIQLAGTEVYPSHQEDGRTTQGVSEFTVNCSPDNVGVLIRRTLDYSYPNQTAEVFISDAGSVPADRWEKAGIWYLAGSNTCLYSNPKGELDNRSFKIETSNRRFRDDEFLIPATLTKGKDAFRVRIKFIPDYQELLPGISFPVQSSWSELKYYVYSYIIPDFTSDNFLK